MKTKPNIDLRRWGLSLVLALTVNLALSSLAAPSGADLYDFGAVQWKSA